MAFDLPPPLTPTSISVYRGRPLQRGRPAAGRGHAVSAPSANPSSLARATVPVRPETVVEPSSAIVQAVGAPAREIRAKKNALFFRRRFAFAKQEQAKQTSNRRQGMQREGWEFWCRGEGPFSDEEEEDEEEGGARFLQPSPRSSPAGTGHWGAGVRFEYCCEDHSPRAGPRMEETPPFSSPTLLPLRQFPPALPLIPPVSPALSHHNLIPHHYHSPPSHLPPPEEYRNQFAFPAHSFDTPPDSPAVAPQVASTRPSPLFSSSLDTPPETPYTPLFSHSRLTSISHLSLTSIATTAAEASECTSGSGERFVQQHRYDGAPDTVYRDLDDLGSLRSMAVESPTGVLSEGEEEEEGEGTVRGLDLELGLRETESAYGGMVEEEEGEERQACMELASGSWHGLIAEWKALVDEQEDEDEREGEMEEGTDYPSLSPEGLICFDGPSIYSDTPTGLDLTLGAPSASLSPQSHFATSIRKPDLQALRRPSA
ncbi:hypothetical protein JCM8547_008483 [Rhodosporidiobolus lusitaniae]